MPLIDLSKPRGEKKKDVRDAFGKQLLLRASDERKQTHQELAQLMQQINALIRKEQRVMPAYQRRFKDEDPRSVFYYRMLRRIGLPDIHARFAPWFLKSQQLELNRWSAVLFARLEHAFYARPDALSTLEVRMREHQLQYDALFKPTTIHNISNSSSNRPAPRALEPRQQNQLMLTRAFRDCSFRDADDANKQKLKAKPARASSASTLASIQDDDARAIAQLELIPEVAVVHAPPGLAPQVRGQLESHGKHVFFTYSGRWRSGEMHGPMGVYTFSDGGKYAGEWTASQPSGAGTTVYPNGVTYTGSFVAGKFDGYGVLEYAPNDTSNSSVGRSSSSGSGGGFRYEGEFKRGLRCGHGKLLLLRSGALYDGEFTANMRDGKGVETSALGYTYTGVWSNNRICGPGTLTCPDGYTVFKATWPQCVLGEAARLVKRERESALLHQETWYRQLLRVRDDLRALDLQYAHWDAEAARLDGDDIARIEQLKKARREKREAQAAAKRAFTEQAAAAEAHNDDSDDSDSSEHDSHDEGDDDEGEGDDGDDDNGEQNV